ncbi:G-protein coupled receptor Mth-like [Atheta coriaria]|uniref:G-protein coupled receptor Mth-like n=1 Tax=Dalotia coriaria TaxID=877792 RepID=UPI0031F3533B
MIRLLIILSCLHIAFAEIPSNAHFCCGDSNVLINRKCANGKDMDLTCTPRVMLDPDADNDEQLVFSDDGLLQYPTQILHFLEKSDYCVSKLEAENGSEVAIICYDAAVWPNDEKFYLLRASCGIISVVFLVATLSVYCLVPSLRDLQGKCIMHNIGALAIAMLNLSIVQLIDVDEDWCLFCAFFSYFTFMTAFFWLNVTSFHIWKTVVHPNIAGSDNQWYFGYLIYGHGMPLIFLIMLLFAHYFPGSHLNPRLGVTTCWFAGLTETWAYFYGPVAILLLLNIIMFVWCVSKLWIERKTMDDLKTKSLKYKVRLYIKLFVIMGIMWIFEVISSVLDHVHAILDYVWIVTDYVNVLQGALIFFLLVVLRKRALRGLSSRGICCMTFPSTWKNFNDEEEAADDDGEQPNTNGQA